MVPTTADRKAIAETYPNHRDASNPKTPVLWRNKPKQVPIPSNPKRTVNPFSGDRMKSNLKSTHPQANGFGQAHQKSSNPNRSQTLASLGMRQPPAKRRKAESSGIATTSRYWQHGNATPSPASTPTAGASTIDIIDLSGDQEEDLGVLLSRDHLFSARQSSSDPMILVPGQYIHGDPFYEGSERVPRRLAQDGMSTEKLRRRIEGGRAAEPVIVDPGGESESIESASAFDKPDPPTANSQVKTRIAQYEKREDENRSVPHYDLSKIKADTKGRMKAKPKNLNADPLTDSTLCTPVLKQKSQKRPVANGKLGPLPIKTWFTGTQRFDDGRYFLAFEGNKATPKLVVKKDRRSVFSILIDSEIESAEVSRPDSSDFIIVLQTTKFQQANRATRYFTPGSKDFNGKIAFQIDTSNDSWNIGVGRGVYQYFKEVAEYKFTIDHLDGHASRTIWNSIVDNSHRTIQQTEPGPSGARAKSQQSPLESDNESIGALNPLPLPIPMMDNNLAQPAGLRPPLQPLRRSSRQTVPAGIVTTQNSPPEDIDELILVYPPTGTGAVNITRGDVNRLQPGQYLNDTLIEFALKLWLNNLRLENPELAEQIHVFSSFFYKKLNAKDKEEGYKSVRKWTQKFDIFKKKYIIVPINEHLHWYLAIIYQPEHTLSPPPPQVAHQKPLTRKRKRESDASLVTNDVAMDNQPTTHQDDPWNPNDVPTEIVLDSTLSSPMQQGEVLEHDEEEKKEVEDIVYGVERSCSISEPSESQIAISGRNGKSRELELMNLESPPPSPPWPMDVDQENISEPGASTTGGNADNIIKMEKGDENFRSTSSVAPTRFYSSSKNKGKQREGPAPFPLLIGPDSEKEEEPEPDVTTEDGYRHTWIFTFDSLNGAHPGAIRNLQEYLRFEAFDKKSLTEVTLARGKKALVPTQTNYCDCGVYLVHFVRTFMKDPEGSVKKILTRTGRITPKERADDWEGGLVKSCRQDLTQQIYELQEVWKKEKLVNEDPKGKEVQMPEHLIVEDSDDDIIIEEAPVAVPVGGKGRTKQTGKKTIKKPSISSAERFRT